MGVAVAHRCTAGRASCTCAVRPVEPLLVRRPRCRHAVFSSRNALARGGAMATVPVPVALELEALVSGLEPLSAAWAHTAAVHVWGANAVPGGAAVYAPLLAELLPVVVEPSVEAVALVRLLADEGVIGGRSVSGQRSGPVVGQPRAGRSSRPLLLAELQEHWASELRPACLLRWCRGGASSEAVLEAELAAAYEQAQAEVAWRVLDGRGQCLGAGGGSGSGSGSNGGNSSSNSSSSNGNQAPHALLPETVVTVRPHSAAVAAVLRSSSAVLVASTYPPDVTAAALAAAGLSDVQERILHTVHAPSFSACAAQLAPLLVPRRADSSSNSGPRRSPTVPLLIASSPARAAAAAAVLHSEAMSWGLQQPLPVPVAEWACAAPRLRARALARRDSGLLSEVELAELLGVTGCDAVMDCVAWRA